MDLRYEKNGKKLFSATKVEKKKKEKKEMIIHEKERKKER